MTGVRGQPLKSDSSSGMQYADQEDSEDAQEGSDLVYALRGLDHTLRQHMEIMEKLIAGPMSFSGLKRLRGQSGSGVFKEEIRPLPEVSLRKREDKVRKKYLNSLLPFDVHAEDKEV